MAFLPIVSVPDSLRLPKFRMTSVDTHLALTQGDLIQWYRVEKILGRGGFGVTYLATDTNLDHRVAIKEYLPAPLVSRQPDKTLTANTNDAKALYSEGLQRFLREAKTLVKFRHPNIVRVMAVFEENNTAYLVMEYEEGEQFNEYVKSIGGISESRLKSLVLSVIDGLDQVHQRGFIHRDIKPVNLIIRKDGSPVLLDFGSTRPLENDLKVQHTSFVSVGYTPLEQYQEGAGLMVGPWTDIYSLGATLYYAISGVTPVSPISRLAALVKKSKDPLRPAMQIGSGKYGDSFLQAIDWALGFRIEDRPQSLSQWRTAVDAPMLIDTVELDDPIRGVVTLDDAVIQSAASNRSKLRVRNPEIVRKHPQKPKQRVFRVRRLAGVVVVGVMVALAAKLMFANQQQRQALNDLVLRADIAFVGGDHVSQARPLYLEVLAADSTHQHASDRLDQINDLLVEKIRNNIATGKFELADTAIEQVEGIDRSRAPALRAELAQQRVFSARQEKLTEIQSLIDRRSYQLALARLSVFEVEDYVDPQIVELKASAVAAIEKQEEQEKQRAQSAIEVKIQEKSRLDSQRRFAAANERQRQRRRNYRQYLSSAEQALQSGEIESAKRWLASATALQISDSDLDDIEERVVATEKFLNTPLSDYEISYAHSQFKTLERAIESRNTTVVNEITETASLRRGLFDSLLGRYTQISVRIINLEPKLDPKRATATLRIEKMVLPNGDVVYPSSSYQDTKLSLVRKRYNWAQISW